MSRGLTATQRIMLRCSAVGVHGNVGHGVGLMGAGNWSTARKLEDLGLGWIERGQTGSAIGGHFYANADGLSAVSSELIHE